MIDELLDDMKGFISIMLQPVQTAVGMVDLHIILADNTYERSVCTAPAAMFWGITVDRGNEAILKGGVAHNVLR